MEKEQSCPETTEGLTELVASAYVKIGRRTELDFEKLSKLFHLPLKEAERVLGVSRQIIKRCCMRNGMRVLKW